MKPSFTHEVRCGIFHLWHLVGSQFGIWEHFEFQSLELGMPDLNMTVNLLDTMDSALHGLGIQPLSLFSDE